MSEGEEIAAQVQSLPEPGKALTLTTRRLIKGPRVIVTPGSPGVNVSKKIGNPVERERLEAAVRGALSGQSESLGAIVRTSAKRATGPELAREIASLLGDFPSPIAASVRDWLVPTPDAILAPEELARHWLAEPSRLFGDADAIATLHAEPDAFDAQGIWEEIENLKSPEVSVIEGSMVLEPTRALVAVDVNSGGDFSSAAGLKVNIAVARALPRQLRLRGLGGKIAVDFAPMPKQHRRTVEEALAKAFRADPIETALVGWTSLGLFEIQRKRERWPLMELL